MPDTNPGHGPRAAQTALKQSFTLLAYVWCMDSHRHTRKEKVKGRVDP
jgi:hypothetical protein